MPAPAPDLYEIQPQQRWREDRTPWSADPAPAPGELMSSWLCRTATAHRIAIAPFLAMLRRKVGPIGDPDRAENPALVRFLSQQTGHPWDVLIELCRYGPSNGNVPATTLGAPRYCPQCWVADVVPHLRWEWRCELAPVCEVHRRMLMRACPACAAPLDPLASRDLRPLTSCSGCGADLRECEGRAAAKKIRDGQGVLLDMVALAAEIESGTLIAAMLENLRAESAPAAGGSTMRLLNRLYDVAKAGEGALLEFLPGDGPAAMLRATAMQSAGRPWVDRRPLPVRCWPDLDREAPVYADALANRQVRWTTTFCNLLMAYAGSRGYRPATD